MSDSSKPPATGSGSLFSFNPTSGTNTSSQTGNLFGAQSSSQAQQSTGNTTTLFGRPPQTNLFGGNSSSNPAGAQNTSSIFGSGATQSGGSTPTFSFGSKPGDGNKDTSTSNIFGGITTPNKSQSTLTTGQSQPGNLFGASTGNTGGSSSAVTPTNDKPSFTFANVSTTPAGPPPASTGTSLFNAGQNKISAANQFGSTTSISSTQQPAISSTSSSLFGQKSQTATSTQAPNPPIFGASSNQGNNQSAQPSATLFGNSNQGAQSNQASNQNQRANPTTGFNLFQGPSTASSGTVTTSRAQDTSNKTPMFGSLPSTTTSGQASSTGQTSLFNTGAPAAAPAIASQPPSSNIFAQPNQSQNQNQKDTNLTSSAPSGFSLFGSTGQTKTDAASSQPETAKTSSTAFSQPTTGATTTSLFGASSKTAAPSATTAPTTSLFGTMKSGETNTTAPGKQASSTSAETTTINTGANTSANKATVPDTTTSSSTDLGASTSGPAPTTQSRLKNKSMDDIITRWAADLSKYQKDFQKQAEKVMEWDRLLLDNGNAISKLYAKTYQAERDTAEVERQLSIVEGNQDELTQWLDRYEKEVDELVTKQVGQGEALQGPDQERERTFQTAGRVSERLNDMGRDLTSMIDEINEASAAISKTNRPDDPLSQIVRILNSHLSQLQQIDQSTAALNNKVEAARKEVNAFSGIRGSANNEAVDNFYNSYLRGP